MAHHEYILENYLVNYVFSHLFPLARITLYESYAEMVLYYSLIKMYLIGLSGAYKVNFCESDVIDLISAFDRNMIHLVSFFDTLRNKLNPLGFLSKAYLSIMIKN